MKRFSSHSKIKTYFVGKKKSVLMMSFLAGDENLRPTKIKGHLKNLFKREVTNFLSTKKKQEKVFSLREIF